MIILSLFKFCIRAKCIITNFNYNKWRLYECWRC
nr:MAG TPA: hypothetical protein [Bacteriophage sp.]